MTIDMFADIACPWCYIGETRLEQALDRYLELRNTEDPEIEELQATAESRQPVASGHRQQEETPPEAVQAGNC